MRIVEAFVVRRVTRLELDQMRQVNELFFKAPSIMLKTLVSPLDQMLCPACQRQVTKEKHSDPFVCNCGWKSN